MSKLILHIGFHKTGSSSLQKSLLLNQEKLSENKWSFFSLDKYGNSSNFIQINSEKDNIQYTLSKEFESTLKNNQKENLIISGEHFSLLGRRHQSIIQSLKEVCHRYFDEITIVVYLRRQDKLALSFKQQASKGSKKGEMISSLLCGHSASALPEITPELHEYLDYYDKLSVWSDIFCFNNLLVVDFENLIENDICIDFSQRLNLGFRLPPERINSGVKKRFSLISHNLIKHQFPVESIKRIRRNLAHDNFKILPQYDEVKKFMSHFLDNNENLSKFDINFNQDYDNYPKSRQYGFNEDDIEALFSTIKKSIGQITLTTKEINNLRDSAVALEKIDIQKAYNLMKIAHRFRPNGSFINKKIVEYTNILNLKKSD
ncbi:MULTISPECIES: hypothetical protein [unclassified Vibrio]|uniref:Sulfotransferase domain-containing protein n=1 Tax=Vibrio sp. HB236076 TaxID=3232307 RepID=A0AB39HFU3_9VIBR|nr:hypothetical protein [Vibrio sp. HB161653]MDP5254345.1 hypothetical protein [Vibrio sp. HB161653]